jgi:hypothetical protein
MSRWHQADGFQLVSGVLALIAGPILLAKGAPAGWSLLLMATGALVLLAQWAIMAEITFETTDSAQAVIAVIGVVCVGLAVVYLTRAANDLPRLFPGHDADSENFRVIPGLVSLTVGLVALGRAFVSARPHRAPR